MVMPANLPPVEIIEALEAELESTFVHFVITKEGEITGIFQPNDGEAELIIGFEARRELLDIDAQLESVIGEMDDFTLIAIKDMLQSVLDDLTNRLENTVNITPDGDTTPEFDNWFSP